MYKFEKRSTNHERFINPSFSSTLLDQIYRSIDEGDQTKLTTETTKFYREQKPTVINKPTTDREYYNYNNKPKTEKTVSVAKETDNRKFHLRDHDQDALFFSSTSISSDSSSGGFSSSDTDSLYGTKSRASSCFVPPRPKPVRTSTSFRFEKEKQGNHVFDGFCPSSQNKQGTENGGEEAVLIKNKSRAVKIYNNLKKVKQPISPGGKLTSFLNSLFANSNNEKKTKTEKPTKTMKQINTWETHERKIASTCSSASSFSRSCLSKTASFCGRNDYKTVRFCGVEEGRAKVEEATRKFLNEYHCYNKKKNDLVLLKDLCIDQNEESSMVFTRANRGGRGGVAEGEVEQENKDANVAATPAVGSRRRLPAVSTRRKKEVIVIEDDDDSVSEEQGKAMDVAKTPAVAPSSRTRAGRSVRNKTEISDGTSVQKAYSTRRSVRLVGKSLSKMSLADTKDMESTKNDDVSEEMSAVSQHEEDSVDTEKGTSSQTESYVVSQNTDEVEVSSLNKADCESQSHDSGSEVKSTDAEDVLQAEPKEEGSENVNHVEVSHEDPSLNLQDSFETCADSNEAGSEQSELVETCDSAEIENKECFGAEQDQDMEFAAPEEVSVEIADQTIASLTVAEPEDAFEDVPNQDVAGLSLEVSEEAFKEIADPVIAPLNVVVPDDTFGDDPDQDVADISVVLPEESSEEITHHAIARETAVVPDVAIETSSEEHQVEEVLEPEPEKVDCVSSTILAEKDEISGDAGAENEVCTQSFKEEKESNEVENVILQLSMLDVAVKGEEDLKDTSEKQEAEAQTDESEEHAAEEDTEFDEVAHINDQKTSDIKSMVFEQINGEPLCSAQSEIKEIANEIQAVPSIECGTGNPTTMKENSKTIDVQNASLRVLRKLLREKLEGKVNMINNDDVQMQGVEKKRTALQALPQNQLAE